MSLPPSSEPIISVSGLRGVVGTTLTPDVAVRYISAFRRAVAAGAGRCYLRRPHERAILVERRHGTLAAAAAA